MMKVFFFVTFYSTRFIAAETIKRIIRFIYTSEIILYVKVLDLTCQNDQALRLASSLKQNPW